MQKKKEEGIIDSSDKEIVAEAERLDVKAMGPLVLTEVLFNEKIREQIKKYRRHFLRVSNFRFFINEVYSLTHLFSVILEMEITDVPYKHGRR